MDVDGIAAVVCRASQLRSKISTCIDRATQRKNSDSGDSPLLNPGEEVEEDDEAAERLLDIRHALEALERKLGFLQELQLQQRYEREAILAEIDHSRKMLLKKLKEYRGEDLEVIHEAAVFAGETVEQDDLLLPPYPSRLPDSLILDDSYHSLLSSTREKSAWNGNVGDARPGNKGNIVKSNKQKDEASGKSSHPTRLKLILGMAAKTVLTLVGVISVLSLAGFEPKLQKRRSQFNVLDLFQRPVVEKEGSTIECPPGKVLVIEDGKPRCLVKERVEIPFEPVVTTPDISYGYG